MAVRWLAGRSRVRLARPALKGIGGLALPVLLFFFESSNPLLLASIGPARGDQLPGNRRERLIQPGLVLVLVSLVAAGCSAARPGHQATPSSTTPKTTTSTVPGPVWSEPETVTGGAPLEALQCPTTSTCVALDASGDAYSGSGTHWSPGVSAGLAGTGRMSLSCPSATFCAALAVGTDQVASWNGAGWSSLGSIPSASALQAVGCASTTFCVAVDALGDAFYFRGSGWTEEPNDWGSVASISCASANFCISVLEGVSEFDGQDWTEPQEFDTTSNMTSVSCPTSTFCAAVDITGEVITWNGSAWAGPQHLSGSEPTPFGSGADLTGVSCATATFCVAVDTVGDAFVWNGQSWSSPIVIDRGIALTSISCPATGTCFAVDSAGKAIAYR